MKTLSRTGIQRMTGNGSTVVGGAGSSGSGGSGGGSSDYAAEAGHALEADHATSADSATEATHATSADTATTAQNLASDSTDWNKIADKTIAQTISEAWTFAKGIVSTLKSYFNGGIEVTNGITTDTMTASGAVQAATLIANAFKTVGFTEAVNMIGKGFGVKLDANGLATMQADNLLILGRLIVNSLNIREVNYIGGTFYLSPAGSTVAIVQKLYASSTSNIPETNTWTTTASYYNVGYRLLWKADDGTTSTMNNWKQGDQAYCQTYNVTNAAGTALNNQYYWRLVVRVGQTTIDGTTYNYADIANVSSCKLYSDGGQPLVSLSGSTTFVGRADSLGTEPKSGDKVVVQGSQYDATRCGVVIITAEGDTSIGIYDNIIDFTAIASREIHYLSKTEVRMRSDKFYWRSSGGTLQSQAAREQGLLDTGIDINNRIIKATADKFEIQNNSGVKTFGVDADGNLYSSGSASFGGTIKAKNFYQSMTLVWSFKKCWELLPDGTHSILIYYHSLCTDLWFSEYQTRAGQTYSVGDVIEYNADYDPYEDFFSDSSLFGPNGNFMAFVGESGIVEAVNSLQNQSDVALFDYVAIPSPADYAGKRIEIKNRGTGQDLYVYGPVDTANPHQFLSKFYNYIEDYPNNVSGRVFDHISINPGDSVELWSDGTYWVKI